MSNFLISIKVVSELRCSTILGILQRHEAKCVDGNRVVVGGGEGQQLCTDSLFR